MNKLRIITFLCLAVVSAGYSYGEKISKKIIITGYVDDVYHYPVTDAIIMIDKNKTRVVTDEKGFYKVTVRSSATSIGIISLTYGMLEENINGRTRIDFTFPNSIRDPNTVQNKKPKEEEINIGYGSVDRKNLATSVGKIDGTEKKYESYNSVYDMLQGSVPGVQVNKNNVLIQGPGSVFLSNEPLFIVDGVPVSSLEGIPPQMVKSIEVLKGASGSIYGSRGASGVILIDQIDHPYEDEVATVVPEKATFATTMAAADIKVNSVRFNGIVNAVGLSTNVVFEYGTALSYGNIIAADQSPLTGNGSTNVSAYVSDLKAGVIYHYRVVATNSLGKTIGADVPFTLSARVPSVQTNQATNTSPRTAQLNGTVNAQHLSTTVTFEYGTNQSYGSSTAAVQSPLNGNSSARVSANIADLKPNTTYHYRIVATNDLGTINGEDMTFTSEYFIGECLNGGYIFYIDETGEHGLVCALTDQSRGALWAVSAPAGAAGRAVGTGYQNTKDIIAGCPEEGIAARLCYDLEMNGYSDWFLPSIDELMLMYTNLYEKGAGGFEECFYWSSTQDKYGAWVVSFYYGNKSNQERNENAIRTRAIRAF